MECVSLILSCMTQILSKKSKLSTLQWMPKSFKNSLTQIKLISLITTELTKNALLLLWMRITPLKTIVILSLECFSPKSSMSSKSISLIWMNTILFRIWMSKRKRNRKWPKRAPGNQTQIVSPRSIKNSKGLRRLEDLTATLAI